MKKRTKITKSDNAFGRLLKTKRQECKLTQEQLARKAEIPYTTLTKVESGVIKNPSAQLVSKIARALGVSLDSLLSPRIYLGPSSLVYLWEDVLNTMSEPGEFMCISGIDEKRFVKADQQRLLEFIEQLRLRGFKQKLLCCEGDTYFLEGKHIEYRSIPKEHFNPTPIYVYGNKVSFIIWEEPIQVMIIDNHHLADAYRKQFLFIWQHANIVSAGVRNKRR